MSKPTQRHVKGVIFDMFNTLIYREKSDFTKVLELLPPDTAAPEVSLSAHADRVVADYYRAQRHLPWALSDNMHFWKKLYEHYLAALHLDDPKNLMANELATWSRDPLSFVIDPEAVNVLTELKNRGYRVGMLSNWDVTLPQFCREIGLEPYLDIVLASDEVGIRKPKAGIFLEGCLRLGIQPHAVLYVGDSLKKDIGGGNAAGLLTCWLNVHNRTPAATATTQPTLTIHSLEEVLEYLPQHPSFRAEPTSSD